MKFQLSLLCAMAFVAMSSAAHAEFKVDKVNLLVGNSAVGDDFTDAHLGFKDLNRPKGAIYIHETDEVAVAERTTFIPVDIRIFDKGLLAKGSGTSGQMNLIPLNGHLKVADLLGTYQGGTAGVGIVLNLDETLLVNEHSVLLNDVQSLLFGLGAKAAYRKILILPVGTGSSNVSVSVSSDGSKTPTISQSMTYADALQKQLK